MPILALAYELKQLQPGCQIIYVGERQGGFVRLTANSPAIDDHYAISAGKFRRYHGESLLRRLTDLKTIALNLRDMGRVLRGISQAWRLLGKLDPDVVFLKGGFVGVPVGVAAALRRMPIVTHDSDATAGLANRLVSRWTRLHATALSAEYYPYPPAKVQTVGVLVEPSFQAVTASAQAGFKRQLNLPEQAPVLLITGGSLGAQRLNQAVAGIAAPLLEAHPSLHIIHQVGQGKAGVYGDYRHDRLQVLEFLAPMAAYTGAADVVVARASANTLAELGVQGKACIAVPSPYLSGGHQLKNAQRLAEQGAAVVIAEAMLHDPQQGLLPVITELLASQSRREQLGRVLQSQTIPDAAHRLAVLLLAQATTP